MATKQNHLYLIDGSGYIFRAYHRLPPLSDPQGTPVGAVYGFTAMLWKLIEDLHGAEHPTHLAVIFDAGKTTFRNGLYADYKANRPPPPEDLIPQFPLIRDAVRAFSVPCIEQDGFEADDLIASYAQAAVKQGFNVTIVSSDKDLMQLIKPGIDMLDTMKNQRIDRAEVIEKFGVPPEQVGEVLALMGDAVDNVPGVPGVGPKTAAELIRTYGTVDAVLANADEIKKPKLRETLINHAEDARLSRVLVELKCDMELPVALDELTLKDPPHEPLGAFLRRHGFKSLVAKLGRNAVDEVEAPEPAAFEAKPFDHKAYETVTTVERLDWWIAEATRRGLVAVDTETDDLDAVRANLVGISLALEAGLACYIPVGHTSGEGLLAEPVDQLDKALVVERLRPLLADPAVLKVGQNFKYDIIVFRRVGLEVAPYEDTMLLSYALDAGKHGHGMDELSERHLGHKPIAFKDVCGTGRNKCTFDKVPLDRATEYAAEDADVTFRLYQLFRDRLWREGVTRIYETVDRPLIPVLADMERAGIHVNRAGLNELSAAYAVEIASLEEQIYALAGERFTIGSPKQLGEVLFDRLGAKGGKKGKSGAYVTDVTELEKLAGQGVEMAQKVLDWRQLTKLKSTYTDALQAQINPETDRVHTSFSMAVASTGRLSSTDPNLQNIPIRTELGRKIRHAFVAEPGNVILAADYNQIELRIIAHMANVPELKRVYEEGGDIHALTAREVFGADPANGDAYELRRKAKTINFAIIYGISAFGLAGRLGIDRAEAARYIDTYFARFPGIKDYMGRTINECRERGYVCTLFGRKTHLPLIHSKLPGERQFAERAAINAPIQGTSADIIKRAMARLPLALRDAGLETTRMLLQVHDELVFEVPEKDVDRATEVIRSVMCQAHLPAVELSVPLGVEVGTGPSWGAAH